jgi:hypothetical protein
MTAEDGETLTYAQLEQGARFLADRAQTDAERETHLAMANRYVRLGEKPAPRALFPR